MAAGQLKERELNELEGEEDRKGDDKDDSLRTGPPSLGKCSPLSLLVEGEMFWEELEFFSEQKVRFARADKAGAQTQPEKECATLIISVPAYRTTGTRI